MVGNVQAQQSEFPDEPVEIGFAAHSIDLGAIFGQLREGFREHLDEAGLEYEFYQAALIRLRAMLKWCKTLKILPHKSWTMC
ncbi:hypothetical protein HSBAA_13030 [Vreelandella sulfidaeris]|uniref:Uncharacterized protein n=1 Tax=Vreelandella sulfidaeris TaxID=115553 RepID=A0A455U2W8_9GAMM|nr:hypothetical protein HSBAA_13030 [Halomonas sulfidaeris]